ncbi:DUF3558 domain-containing protein [Saccharothrix isguenensis]
MNRALTRISLACVTASALVITACSDDQGGTPTPQTLSAASTTSSGPKVSDTKLVGIKACDLLTSGEAKEVGLTSPGEAGQVAGTSSCDWTVSGNGGLLVSILPDQGIDALNIEQDKASPIEVGKYDATQIPAPRGGKAGCEVFIQVTDSSTVEVTANLKASSTDTDAACERATKAAELIAPKLP